jgi:hypothetical protein
MEAINSSETLVDFQRTTRRYIPEDNILNTGFEQARAFDNLHRLIRGEI